MLVMFTWTLSGCSWKPRSVHSGSSVLGADTAHKWAGSPRPRVQTDRSELLIAEPGEHSRSGRGAETEKQSKEIENVTW